MHGRKVHAAPSGRTAPSSPARTRNAVYDSGLLYVGMRHRGGAIGRLRGIERHGKVQKLVSDTARRQNRGRWSSAAHMQPQWPAVAHDGVTAIHRPPKLRSAPGIRCCRATHAPSQRGGLECRCRTGRQSIGQTDGNLQCHAQGPPWRVSSQTSSSKFVVYQDALAH